MVNISVRLELFAEIVHEVIGSMLVFGNGSGVQETRLHNNDPGSSIMLLLKMIRLDRHTLLLLLVIQFMIAHLFCILPGKIIFGDINPIMLPNIVKNKLVTTFP